MVCWVRNHRRFFLRENQSLQAIPNRLHRAAVHLPQHSTGHAGARPGSGQPWAVTALMVGTAFLPQDTKPSICYPLNLSNGKVWLCGSKWDNNTETRWLGKVQSRYSSTAFSIQTWSCAIYSKPRSHTHSATLKTESCKNVFRPNMTFELQETRARRVSQYTSSSVTKCDLSASH